MGLFSKRRDAPNALPGAWAADYGGVVSAGMHVSPFQDGESFSVRLRNAGHPSAVIDLIFYVVPATQPGYAYTDRFCVQMTVEWIICDDPDRAVASARWSHHTTWDALYTADFETAFDEARNLAWVLDLGHRSVASVLGDFGPEDSDHDIADPVLGWDGQPFEMGG